MARALPNLTPLPLQRRREPFDHRDWLFELKLDGFRALAYVEHGQVRLVSRNGNTFKRFAPLAAEIGVALRVRNAILDGEVVCLDGDGRPLFNALLYRRIEPCFVAFDCLWLDGEDLRRLPLIDRKRVLRRIIPRRPACVQYLPHVARRGVDLFTEIVERDLEGIVAKLRQAPYGLVDGRSPWVKIKNREYTQAVGRHDQFDGFRGERRLARRARTEISQTLSPRWSGRIGSPYPWGCLPFQKPSARLLRASRGLPGCVAAAPPHLDLAALPEHLRFFAPAVPLGYRSRGWIGRDSGRMVCSLDPLSCSPPTWSRRSRSRREKRCRGRGAW